MHYRPSEIAIYTVPLTSVHRAVTASRTEGYVQVITKKWSSKILGRPPSSAPRAGEMLAQLSTAMYAKIALRKLAGLIHPDPTYSLAIRKTADLWLTQTLLPQLRIFLEQKNHEKDLEAFLAYRPHCFTDANRIFYGHLQIFQL